MKDEQANNRDGASVQMCVKEEKYAQSIVRTFSSFISKKKKKCNKNAHLESDVVELAAVADGRSAGMDHAVHVRDGRAAPRTFAGSFPDGAARRGAAAAARAFAPGSLLARHGSRFWMDPSVERPSSKSTQQPSRSKNINNYFYYH